MKVAALLLLLASSLAYADDQPPAELPEPTEPREQPAAPDPLPPTPAPAPAPVNDAAVTAPPPRTVQVVLANGLLQRHGLSPDLEITGGLRVYKGGDQQDTRWWFARVRAGVVLYNEPNFLSVGIAGQLGSLDNDQLGFEAKYMNLWNGTWLQGGVFPIGTRSGVTMEASIGYGIFGLQYERRVSGANQGDQTLCLTLTAPLGILRVVLQKPQGLIEAPGK
jgi:hypothetical protein